MDFTREDQAGAPNYPQWPVQIPMASPSEVIARLVAAGISPDTKWESGKDCEETPLAVAARHLNISAVEALLAAGANAKAGDSRAKNALMMAVEYPCPDSHVSLVQCPKWRPDASVSLPYRDYPDRWTVVRLLFDAGIPVNGRDAYGNSVLHFILRNSGWELMDPWAERHIFRFLLEKGADPCLRNRAGTSALRVAVQKGLVEAVEMIANMTRVDLADAFPMEEIVAIFDQLSDHESLPDWGIPDPAVSDDLDDRPRLDTVPRRLLDALAGMDRSSRLSSNAPFICSLLLDRGNAQYALALAEILCTKGLEADTYNPNTRLTILRAAIEAGRWSMARALLRGVPAADINAPDSDGQTLLSLVTSSVNGHPNIVLQLVEAGADMHRRVSPTLPCCRDTTPLKRAFISDPDPKLMEEILRRQPIRGNQEAVGQRYLHWIVALRCREGPPAGHIRSWSVWDQAVRALLAAGADPAQVDDNGSTPLSLLLQAMVDDVDLLWDTSHWLQPLSRGVDVNHKNKDDSSVADYLSTILLENQYTADELLGGILKLRPVGEGRMEIRWLK